MEPADFNGNEVSISRGIRKPEEILGELVSRPVEPALPPFRAKKGWHGISLTQSLPQPDPQIRETTAFQMDHRNTGALCMFAFTRKGYIINAFKRASREIDGLPRVQLR